MEKGKFIVFEGLDGSGQSTQAERLTQFLSGMGKKTHLTKEPTNNLIGGLIRGQLKGEWKSSPECLQLLFTADRAHHLEKEVMPLIEKGIWVVCDRYFFSTIAFGSLEIDDTNWLREINRLFPLPDKTFFLRVSPKECIRRIEKSRFGLELFEKEKKLREIEKEYDKLMSDYEIFSEIDGERKIEEISRDIEKKVSKLM